jgi:hypothetical protein
VVSRLALYLLGPPRIERDGVPIRLDRRKAIALLAYLAVTGESHRRASLVNLLWPEYDGTRGRAALRRTLYALRKALGGAWLEVSREEIGLDPGSAFGFLPLHERPVASGANQRASQNSPPSPAREASVGGKEVPLEQVNIYSMKRCVLNRLRCN